MKNLLLLPLLLFANVIVGQTTERKNIPGEITVPLEFQPEGIHVYNKSSGYGTSSDQNGRFELPMATGDTLHFSAVQFEALEVVITQEIMEAGHLAVEVREGLNELPEILIREHELTGNMAEDVNRIQVPQLPVIPPMKGLGNLPVRKLSPSNSAMNEIGGGANHFELIMKGVRLLFPKREKKQAPKTQWSAYEQVVLEKELRSRFDDRFFLDNFGIPVAEISLFIGFVAEKGVDQSLLRKDKELELIQLLMERSELYLSQE